MAMSFNYFLTEIININRGLNKHNIICILYVMDQYYILSILMILLVP